MRRFALSAIGRDRPGIVAGLSRVLLDHALNIEDSQMGILRGHFSVVLILSAGGELDERRLRADLSRCADELGLDGHSLNEIAADQAAAAGADGGEAGSASTPAHQPAPAGQQSPSCIVTVYGADHPGIVHAVTSALAEAETNITDLQTRLSSGEAGAGVYAMLLEVALPAGRGIDRLEQALAAVRRDQGVEVVVRELDEDVL